MGDPEEVIYPNDTTRQIREVIKDIKKWSKDNDRANGREVAIVITKLEEAELFSTRMVKII